VGNDSFQADAVDGGSEANALSPFIVPYIDDLADRCVVGRALDMVGYS
jgi:hypothetical protein